jgi:hypothetical protein
MCLVRVNDMRHETTSQFNVPSPAGQVLTSQQRFEFLANGGISFQKQKFSAPSRASKPACPWTNRSQARDASIRELLRLIQICRKPSGGLMAPSLRVRSASLATVALTTSCLSNRRTPQAERDPSQGKERFRSSPGKGLRNARLIGHLLEVDTQGPGFVVLKLSSSRRWRESACLSLQPR